MFTSILSSLSGLVPSNFFFGAYVPVLLFGFINGGLLYANDGPFRTFARAQIASPPLLTTTALFLASIVAAYVISSVADFIREVLEGKSGVWPPAVRAACLAAQARALVRAQSEYESARATARAFTPATLRVVRRRLSDAAGIGVEAAQTHATESYVERSVVPDGACAAFQNAVYRRDRFDPAMLESAVAELETQLRRFDETATPALDADQTHFNQTLDYAGEVARRREAASYSFRFANFGLSAEPTRLGNAARAVQDYATRRYGIDLDTFWSRLLGVLQNADTKSYKALLDAKTQLDFLVTCAWLAAATTLLWLVLLVASLEAWPTFLAIGILGPLCAYGFYLLAVTNYVAYGLIVRATLDLNRFGLLKALHVPRPSGSAAEYALWTGLRDLSSYGALATDVGYEVEPSAAEPS